MGSIDTSLSENAGVQKMVHGISHDMGAPLRAVVQLSQMLKKRVADRLDERESYWLQLIEESGSHAQKMIEALLIYSRLTTQRKPDEPFLIKEIVEQAICELNSQIEEGSTSIKIEGEWFEFTGCEEQWLLMFTSLIKNALLYQPKDIDHKPCIIICSKKIAGRIQISVEDNGIGVQENLWSVLTTPFKRMQSEEDYPGIGMGLTYSERVAELHGGSLNIGNSSLGGMSVTYFEK